MNIVKRLDTEWRTRGAVGFARFIALRVVQRRADVLFEYDLTELTGGGDPGTGPIVVVDRNNFGSAASAAVEKGVLSGGNHAYVKELQGQGQLLAATDPQGRVTSYAFVVFESFYKRILGEATATPIISNCLTFPAYRGQGLYPEVLRASLRHLAAQGYSRAIITCAPDNSASIRGIEKAGFRRVKTIYSLIVFARWIAVQRNEVAKSKI
jgi:ribosomal protein S18 acetylase RimI-like enzyme